MMGKPSYAEFKLYIDRRLPDDRRRAVEDHLRSDFDAAQRVGAHLRQADALRAELRPIADLRLPDVFDRSAIECRSVLPAPMSSWLIVCAVSPITFAVGVIVGLSWGRGL